MSAPVYPEAERRYLQLSVEAAIRIGLLAMLFIWSLSIVRPFIMPVLWGVIIAVTIMPVHVRLSRVLGGRPKVSATVMTLLAVAALLVPTISFFGGVVAEGRTLAVGLEEGTLQVPPPPDRVRNWPVVGDPVADIWGAASQNLEETIKRYQPQVAGIGRRLASGLGNLAMTVLQFVISFIIAGVLLVSADAGKSAMDKLATRLAGQQGIAFVRMSKLTIRSVAQGVLGIAVIQALLSGIGLAVVGVPGASLWALVVLFLAILQLPPLLVMGPAMVYVFGHSSTTVAVIFMIYGIIVSVSDAFLKPLMLGRGVDVPMLVVLIGAIGGMMTSGIIGLFLGAVILSLFYQLAIAWVGGGKILEGFEQTRESPTPSAG